MQGQVSPGTQRDRSLLLFRDIYGKAGSGMLRHLHSHYHRSYLNR